MIPKLIHLVWIGSDLPEWARRNAEAFKRINPGYAVRLHDECSLAPELGRRYAEAADLAAKADLIRYSVLRREGGWYFDIDFWPVRPVSDVLRRFPLDGSRLFLARQAHNVNAAFPYSNGVLACAPAARPMEWMVGRCVKTRSFSRTSHGPKLVRQLVREHPDWVQVCPAGWWFPLSPAQTFTFRSRILLGEVDWLKFNTDTGRELPYAVHLWGHAHRHNLDYTGDPRQMAVVMNAARGDHPTHAVALGLARLGWTVVRASRAREIPEYFADEGQTERLVVVWNGLRDTSFADAARTASARMLYLEHGFFQRQEYTQADPAGFLHNASWAGRVSGSAPAGGFDRVSRFYPTLRAVRARSEGRIVVLGQVDGDSQMYQSEIGTAKRLQLAVKSALPPGVRGDACFRPHPATIGPRDGARRVFLPLCPGSQNMREALGYATRKQSTTLAAVFRHARFVVAINSNALNEALAAGVPCLCFGPFLGLNAGVVHGTTVHSLRRDMAEMLDGWCPDADAVRNYLAWLAARQWNNAELATGEPMAEILSSAEVAEQQGACV